MAVASRASPGGRTVAKRSAFARMDRDYYRTWDPRAVPPLLPHVPEGTRFVECCAGDGVLMVDLVASGLELVDAYDVAPQGFGVRRGDVFVETHPGDNVIYITNPMWKRPHLHPLIEHLSDRAPTWLLFDAGWAFSQQARAFWPRLRIVQPVGRLKWIFMSRDDSKDDCAWYLFDRPQAGNVPQFYPRAA